MPLGLEHHINDGSVKEVELVDLWRHAALEEGAAFFNVVMHDGEEGVVLDALDDLFFVVEGEVRRNGPRQLASTLGFVD